MVSGEAYRALFEHSIDAILIITEAGRIIAANGAACAMFGYDEDEFRQVRREDIVDVSDPRLAEALEQRRQTGSVRCELRYRRRDGTLFPAQLSSARFADEDGDVCYGTIIHDLSERVALRSRQEESEARWRFALEGTGDGVWDWDLATNRVFYSGRWKAMLGYGDDEIGDRVDEWLQRVHPDDLGAARADVEAYLEGRTGHYASEHRVRCKDGSYKWILDRGLVIRRAADGSPERMIGTHSDVTERRRVDAEVRVSERRLRAIVDATPVPLALNDDRQNIVLVNPAFVRAFGYRHEEVPTLADWWPRAYPDLAYRQRVAEEWGRRLDESRRRGEPFEPMEVSICCRDGSLRTAIAAAAELDGSSGGLHLVTLFDITERKLDEDRLRAARDRADAATRAKSQFLAHMSHELRNPLNAVLGLTQILAGEALSPTQAEVVQKLHSAGEIVLRVISDILDFSRIEADQLRLERRPFEPGAVVERTTRLLEASATAKGLRLSVDAPIGGAGALVGDPLRLEQVLGNLVGNAIKFTEHGGVTLRAAIVDSGPANVRLRFDVRDTGIGIAPDALRKLFQPFTQADGGITRRFGGTGLGLVISKRLVEQMGGTIGATSEAGAGSTFWFDVPFERATTGDAAEAGDRQALGGPRPSLDLRGLRVLAVDDNRMNLYVVERILVRGGASVTLAADGQQALQILRAQPRAFDIVLMDVQMPVMDGLSATRAIRADPQLAAIPVIALTAGVLAEEREAALAAGCNDFLAKPLEVGQLADRLAPLVAAGRLQAGDDERTG